MKLSVKSDYAARAVLGLARHYVTGMAQKAETLAAAQGISPNYLVQVLIELKAKGLVESLRGKAGGYRLMRPPAEITFGEVVRAVHGKVFDTPALDDPTCPPELQKAWQQLQRAVDQAADAITFQQLLDQSSEGGRMFYI